MSTHLAKTLSAYFALQQEIYDHFGYVEDWVAIPLQDQTEYSWFLIGDGPGTVVYSTKPFTEATMTDGAAIYGSPIYTQRHLPKWVYRAADYTMVCENTQTDGNKFLSVFDNALEVTGPERDKLAALYIEHWSTDELPAHP